MENEDDDLNYGVEYWVAFAVLTLCVALVFGAIGYLGYSIISHIVSAFSGAPS